MVRLVRTLGIGVSGDFGLDPLHGGDATDGPCGLQDAGADIEEVPDRRCFPMTSITPTARRTIGSGANSPGSRRSASICRACDPLEDDPGGLLTYIGDGPYMNEPPSRSSRSGTAKTRCEGYRPACGRMRRTLWPVSLSGFSARRRDVRGGLEWCLGKRFPLRCLLRGTRHGGRRHYAYTQEHVATAWLDHRNYFRLPDGRAAAVASHDYWDTENIAASMRPKRIGSACCSAIADCATSSRPAPSSSAASMASRRYCTSKGRCRRVQPMTKPVTTAFGGSAARATIYCGSSAARSARGRIGA